LILFNRGQPRPQNPSGKLTLSGVYAGKHLSFDPVRKAAWGNAMVANPALAGDETGGLGKRGLWRKCEPTSQPKGWEW